LGFFGWISRGRENLLAPNHSALLQSLTNTIAGYRLNEITPITPTHVERWLNQFDAEDQPIILAEMDSLMKRFYFSKVRVKECLRTFLRNDVIATHSPRSVLPHICFLRIQRTGSSQSVLLELIDEILYEDYGWSIAKCGAARTDTYIYIDDGIYTGNRLRYDLTEGTEAASWIPREAPPGCTLVMYHIAVHLEGMTYVERHICPAAEEKGITVIRKHSLMIDNTRYFGTKAEVLWPEELSDDLSVASYVSSLRAMLTQRNWRSDDLFRNNRIPWQETLFSSSQARETVERAFLKKGIRIITACQNPAESMRPLGFIKLGSLGFGTCFVTYRNIANNCPLVLWWGDPAMPASHPFGQWYPLFPRRTNSQ
jgi:hypothetical protein